MSRIVNLLLFISFILGSIFFYFFNDIDLDVLSRKYVYVVLFLTPPVLLLILLLRIKNKFELLKGNVVLVFSISFLAFIVINTRHHKNYNRKHIDTAGGLIFVGTVQGLEISYGTGYFTISYLNSKNSYSEVNFIRSKSFVKDISNGDTVLVLRSLGERDIHVLYDKKPTSEEIEQCKSICYYLNGEIVNRLDIEENK